MPKNPLKTEQNPTTKKIKPLGRVYVHTDKSQVVLLIGLDAGSIQI